RSGKQLAVAGRLNFHFDAAFAASIERPEVPQQLSLMHFTARLAPEVAKILWQHVLHANKLRRRCAGVANQDVIRERLPQADRGRSRFFNGDGCGYSAAS